MSYYDAVKDNWRAFGDIEEVAYADAAGETSGVKARVIEPDEKSLAKVDGLAALPGAYATLVLWDATLAGKKPVGGGVITQFDGTKWTVQAVQGAQWNTQWRCLCIRHRA
ncbi:hypothetical protein LOC68_09855 [Blastopirellula sp. JC732]|uniref:Head decoration protein n=1 Tax=Blastopirellula sediminis TaxID=2894196 RepID=A0A9X1MMN2_9BACT|nr:hypothetical protein [Blastopirellula sediminis]MCC9608521.1 hypothetical protein [Blastopirellula sediminis]MCC9628702.1 hypothetical protein [Blastopirellula sediminis]